MMKRDHSFLFFDYRVEILVIDIHLICIENSIRHRLTKFSNILTNKNSYRKHHASLSLVFEVH